MKSLFTFLLFPVLLFAQSDLDRIPVKGKIESYTISQISGDSLNPTFKTDKKVVFDKKGRTLTSYKKNSRSYSTAEQELNIYDGSTIKNYLCRCADLDKFVSGFVIRDNAELKNMRGYGTANEPTKFVKIIQTDKKGNHILVSHYSEMGYKVGETKSWFDKAGNAIKVEKYNIDGKLTETEVSMFNKTGNVTERIIKRDANPEEKNSWVYDADGKTVKESLRYSGGKLMWHMVNDVKDAGAYKELSVTNKVDNTTRIDKHMYYDMAGRELKLIRLNPDGTQQSRFESTYDKAGNLTSYAVYYKPDVLSTKYQYTYDAKGNWTTMTKHQLVNYQTKDKIEPKMEVSKYKQEIVYLK